jgi:thymidylate synthase
VSIQQALPPCHFAFQFYCHTDGRLSLKFHMRSTDIFLGLPFNIASYGLLLEMVAAVTDRIPGNLLATFGDLHLYDNHRDQAASCLTASRANLPKLELPKLDDIDDYKLADILPNLHDYTPRGQRSFRTGGSMNDQAKEILKQTMLDPDEHLGDHQYRDHPYAGG